MGASCALGNLSNAIGYPFDCISKGNYTQFTPLDQEIHPPSWRIIHNGQVEPEILGVHDIDEITISRVFEEVRSILDETRVKVSLEADRRLRELRELESGWDSCDGIPIPDEVIRTTERVLIEFCDLILDEVEVKDPYISPLPDGGIDLEWESESGAELLLTIHSSENISYLLDIPTGDGRLEESEGRVPQDATLFDLISKIT